MSCLVVDHAAVRKHDPNHLNLGIRFGGDPWIATPEEAQARLLKDIEDWRDYVRIANLTPQ